LKSSLQAHKNADDKFILQNLEENTASVASFAEELNLLQAEKGLEKITTAQFEIARKVVVTCHELINFSHSSLMFEL
jgi:hypothetical protein